MAARHGPKSTTASPGARREFHPRRSAQEGAAVRRHRYAGLGLVRRWRPLAFAAARTCPRFRVRDIEVKDDASCMCSDLVAGTHGRGFWILDDVTPLRQAAEAAAASNAYLFKPATAIRIRFGTNDPTPWPPEVPAGENPPPGALVDYYLPADAAGEVKLEVLNSAGQGDPQLLQQRPGPEPRPGHRSGSLQQALPANSDCGRLRSSACTGRRRRRS